MASTIFTILLLLLSSSPVAVLSDPSDESCLSALRASLSDPSGRLRNWTRPNFRSPCNGFTSYIAGATCNNGRIYKLSLPALSLAGALPALLSNCTNLQTLDLSSNSLTGPIPASLSLLLNLAVLNLSSNLLSGQIPPQLALCAYLNVIDLHSNRLSGQIPPDLARLVRLSQFDVSGNDLAGPIPALLGNRTNASSFLGNPALYGYPLPPARPKGLSVMAIVGIGLASGLLSLLISFTAVCIWLRLTDRSASMLHGDDPNKISHLMPDY